MKIPEKWRSRLKIATWILTGLFIAGCLLTADCMGILRCLAMRRTGLYGA